MESPTRSIIATTGSFQKDFDPILDEYAFFERHATEMKNDLKAVAAYVEDIEASERPFRMLDFGAGTGTFTRAFLWETDLHRRMKLDLTLIEPGEIARGLAFERLRTFTGRQLSILEGFPAGLKTKFELILSNHAVYYVPDLSETVSLFLNHCSAEGRVMVSMAGSENFLIRLWDLGFDLLGQTPPFYRAEDLEDELEERGLNYSRERIFYDICFPDSEENRMKILRFLFGDHLPKFPVDRLLAFFDAHRSQQEIRIETSHYWYVF